MVFKVKKTVFFVVFFSVLFYRESELTAAYSAAFIHECAHAATANFLGIKPKEIKVGILGMNLTLPNILYSKEKIIIGISGPVASFLTCTILNLIKHIFYINSPFYNFFVFSNFAIGAINLLPIFPLDGAVILKSLLTTKKGIINSNRISEKISDIFCLILGFITVAMCIYKFFNPALTGIFCFLAASKTNRLNLGISEKNSVLCGKILSKKRIKYIACHAESELLCLAGYISCDYTLIVAAFYKEKFLCDLNQNDIIWGIKKFGALCTIKEYAEKIKTIN